MSATPRPRCWLAFDISPPSWLHGTKFSDRSVLQFKDMKQLCRKVLARLPNLLWLDLESTMISDRGIGILSSAQQRMGLDLMNTAITENSLAELGRLTNLVYINVQQTEISDSNTY